MTFVKNNVEFSKTFHVDTQLVFRCSNVSSTLVALKEVTFPRHEGVDKPRRLLLDNRSRLPTRSCHIEEEQNGDLTAVSALPPLSSGSHGISMFSLHFVSC